MTYDTLSRIFKICNSLMLYRINLLGFQVTLYDCVFYELCTIVVLGSIIFFFKNY